jgi:hypothetical protein
LNDKIRKAEIDKVYTLDRKNLEYMIMEWLNYVRIKNCNIYIYIFIMFTYRNIGIK